MNQRQFYDALTVALATTPDIYVVGNASTRGPLRALRIIVDGWTYCPITFVAHAQCHPRQSVGGFDDAGLALGLRKTLRDRLVESTDDRVGEPAFSLRTRLTILGIVAPYLEKGMA